MGIHKQIIFKVKAEIQKVYNGLSGSSSILKKSTQDYNLRRVSLSPLLVLSHTPFCSPQKWFQRSPLHFLSPWRFPTFSLTEKFEVNGLSLQVLFLEPREACTSLCYSTSIKSSFMFLNSQELSNIFTLYSSPNPHVSFFIVSFFMSCSLWNLVHFLLFCYNSQWGHLCSEIGSRYPYFTTTAFCKPGNLGPLCYTQWGHRGPLSLLSPLSPWLSWHFSILALLLPLTAPSDSP